MGTNLIPSVDSDTKQFDDDIRARIASNLSDTNAPEGAAVRTMIDARVQARVRGTLPSFRAALAKVRTGARDAKILCVGDSTTAGVGSAAALPASQGGPYAYPHQLASLLSSYVPSARGLAVPPSQLTGSNPDPRWTASAGWSLAAFGWGGGADYTTAENTTTPLVFADQVLADTYDIYYLQATGLGKFSAVATGGVAVTVTTAGATGVMKATVTAAAASPTNSLTITPTAVTPIHIIAVEPYLVNTRKVRVGNAGVGGATAANWLQKSGDFGGIPAIKAYAPDLTIISLGINDSNASVPAATHVANVQQIAAAAAVSGDVILMSPFPSTAAGSANNVSFEKQYAAAVSALGTTYADLFTRFGQPGTDATKNLGMMSDAVHPNALGYADLAQLLAVALGTV